ncbi:ankyrin repeat domain-containing protein [bacterium]|nr:ankyrin repeat domain-containing protein [bacterium]
MNWIPGKLAGLALTAVVLAALPACRKSKETVRSDLKEAGYQLTTDDWFRASRGNDVAALKKFVAGKFPVDTRDAAGDSALHAAAAGGAEGSADYLLNRGLNIDQRGAYERTPLMIAVMADQTAMVRWLLRQGANPKLKDHQGFKPLMLAVRDGRPAAVAELASYNREDLDPALLLAALVGRADVIDALTNFGASVYARMEDGRTPLMIAAQNGHAEAVKLLLDCGASRLTADPDGHTAADLALAAGHPEIAAAILREPLPADLVLDSPVEIAKAMDGLVDTALAKGTAKPASVTARSKPIAGAILSKPVVARGASFAMPPLVMRSFREKELPLAVKSVQGEVATLRLAGAVPREVKVRTGERIPGSKLLVVRMRRRMEQSKLSPDGTAEISVMEVRDESSGVTREWISGVASKSHDPVALVEDSATGKRYLASPGQQFSGADGAEYIISDVRPNQLVVREIASGAVQTIPLRGPRG